jgi:NAD-dependent DNA ligase
MSVIRHACDYFGIPYPEVDYFCTAVFARRSFADDPNIVSFKLQNLISYLGIEWSQKHRAEDDAVMAGTLAQFLLNKHGASDLYELAEMLQVRPGRLGQDVDIRCGAVGTERSPLTSEELMQRAQALKQFSGITQWDPSGDFDGKHVKFTGSFSRVKADYEAALIECNGIPQKAVNKKTNFIVEGIQASDEASAEGSKAQTEARRLKAQGAAIEILDETEFLRLLTS